jgi:hypothetical protein
MFDLRLKPLSEGLPPVTSKESTTPKFFKDDGTKHPENVAAFGTVTKKKESKRLEEYTEGGFAQPEKKELPKGTQYLGGLLTVWWQPFFPPSPSTEKKSKVPVVKFRNPSLNNDEVVEISTKEKKKSDVEEPEIKSARDARIATFISEAASNGVATGDAANLVASHNVAKYVWDDEEVVQVIKAVEISGMPATTEAITVTGSIEVALVRTKHDRLLKEKGEFFPGGISGARLIFSVSRGIQSLHVKENFSYGQLEARGLCACCFPNSCLACMCPCFVSGSFLYDYNVGQDLTNQFSYLSVTNTVIDAMAYNHNVQEYAALASGSTAADCCTGMYCCSCNCCCCCTCPTCLKFELASSTDGFVADEDHVVGKQPNTNGIKEGAVAGVTWSVGKAGTNEIYVVITYRSVLDQGVRQCKIKLPQDPDGRSYDEARQFVTALAAHRGPIFDHAAAKSAPVGGFSRDLNGGGWLATGPLFGFSTAIGGGSATNADRTASIRRVLSLCVTAYYYSMCCCLVPGMKKPSF